MIVMDSRKPQRKSKCFDKTCYFTPNPHSRDKQCIAPTQRGTRCRWLIREEELDEIASLIVELRDTMSINGGRRSIVERIILLRVCGDAHREKLEEKFRIDESCLDGFVTQFANSLLMIAVSSAESPARSNAHIDQASNTRVVESEQPRHRYILRPRGAVAAPGRDQSLTGTRRQIFAPYPSRPGDSMNDVLVSPVPKHFKTTGRIYALTWPSEDGYFKIGYTSNPVDKRIRDLQECHPGIELLYSINCPYPERMERLVHLELSSSRHQILICSHCDSTHYEWFRLPQSQIISAMTAWRNLIEHYGLYSNERHLLLPWTRIVESFGTAATAQSLLAARAAEAEAEAEAKVQAEAEALAVSTMAQAATVVHAAEVADAGTLTKPVSAVDEICQRAACILSRKSMPFDWETILDSFSDFMRLVDANVP
nr:hypothetical protein CFP56_70796 [Quercus suber]